ncbi:MAG: YtxH domain-containing protein [Bacteroidota bacterium]
MDIKSCFIFLLGLGMGTVLGVLVAPDTGKNTRRRIREEADKLIDKAVAQSKIKLVTDEKISRVSDNI